jgi:hypothetical protein
VNKRIVYNRIKDGGVTICSPSDWAIAWMGCGGFWNNRSRGFVELQIESQISRGIAPDVARRYARVMQFGGCTTAEALEIIRDRDCSPHGMAIELWDAEDISTDRWFRDAWHRSHNGGPISIDLKLAKPIQFRHIRSAVDREIKRRKNHIELFDVQVDVDLLAIREKIIAVRDEIELRHIWPAKLSMMM